MIRINLLPVKQDRRREAARNQILLALVIIVVECVICGVVQMSINTDVDSQKNKNSAVQADVQRIKKQITDHKTILAEIKEFEKREDAINGLMKARTGPVHVMLELSNLLSRGGRPTIDNVKYQEMIQIDPTAGYDENWDYRRLWITEFSEKEKKLTLKGQALSHEDVAEFLRRVNLSDYFVSNELISTKLAPVDLKMETKDNLREEPVVHFELKSEIRYR
jgi:type IV pilus assembly protein PilN